MSGPLETLRDFVRDKRMDEVYEDGDFLVMGQHRSVIHVLLCHLARE
jgi:hypothetical protein